MSQNHGRKHCGFKSEHARHFDAAVRLEPVQKGTDFERPMTGGCYVLLQVSKEMSGKAAALILRPVPGRRQKQNSHDQEGG